jgi:DNA-binding FadR family transcriptional regulator
VTETDLTGELASLRRAVERIAAQLAAESNE